MRIRSGVAAIAVAGAGIAMSLTVSAPAQAQVNCPSQYYCSYEHMSFTGEVCKFKASETNYMNAYSTLWNNCNDEASSWVNNGIGDYRCILVFRHAHYSDHMWFSNPSYNPNDDLVDAEYNDQASSHTWRRC